MEPSELRFEFLDDQVPELALRSRPQHVKGATWDLPGRELGLAEHVSHEGTVAVRQQEVVPLFHDPGKGGGDGPHLGAGVVPGARAPGPIERIASESENYTTHARVTRDRQRTIAEYKTDGRREPLCPRRSNSESPLGDAVAEGESNLFCPLEFRYGRAEVRRLFSREQRLHRALLVEAALARAQGQLGIIPEDAAKAIAGAVDAVHLDRVDALESELRHDVMAISRALAEAAGASGAWVHFGATSADITDTALALEYRESLAVLRGDLGGILRTLAKLAHRHRATAEVARTHGQHAVPMSFGYKLAVFAAEFLRHRQRLDQLAPRLIVGKMAGAVGTGASFGPHAVDVERLVMEQLGLTAEEAPTQVVGRDRVAEFTNLLALMAGTAERLSTEIRNLQRTEIAEVQEPFDEARQVGSSTMAQKRNPMAAENVTSLARLVRAFALPPLENLALWHERDLTNSANERVVVPHSILLLDDMLHKLDAILAGLQVDTARMEELLHLSGGAIMAENLLLGLTAKRVPRAEAHELLRGLTRSEDSSATLAERASKDERLRAFLTEAEIAKLLDPSSYVQAAAAKTDRILARVDAALTE